MTFGWRNMLAIEGDIKYRFSIGGEAQRHSDGTAGRIRQLFNANWRTTRELVALASDGEGAYLIRGATTTFASVGATAAAVTGEAYAEIDWPTDAVAIGGVRCLVNGTRWYPLRRKSFNAIHDFQSEDTFGGYNAQRGPVAFASRLLPDGSGSTETAGKIMIAPVPVGGSFAIWYLQGWTDRTADADTIPGMANWVEHAILGTLMMMAQPDADSQKQFGMWEKAQKKIEDQITARAQKLNDGLPLEPRDARGDGYDDDLYRSQL